MPRFDTTYCSQCGREFGPGDHGFSHCSDHRGLQRPAMDATSPIAHAAALFAASGRKPGAEQFVNLLLGGRYGNSVEIHTDIDRAAEDAHDHPDLGRYFGTLHIAADGPVKWLDLRDHAHVLAQAEEEQMRRIDAINDSLEADRQFLARA